MGCKREVDIACRHMRDEIWPVRLTTNVQSRRAVGLTSCTTRQEKSAFYGYLNQQIRWSIARFWVKTKGAKIVLHPFESWTKGDRQIQRLGCKNPAARVSGRRGCQSQLSVINPGPGSTRIIGQTRGNPRGLFLSVPKVEQKNRRQFACHLRTSHPDSPPSQNQ